MAEAQETLGADLAWLKALAESGRSTPLQTGPYLIAGGVWFGSASGLLALAQLGLIGLPASAESWLWIVSALGFAATLIALIRRDRQASESGHNRLINATWSGAGFGIFVFWAATTVLAYRIDDTSVLYTISPAVLTIYGLVWWIKGSLTGARWMSNIAYISFASTIAVALAAGTPFSWLAYTAALACSALAPGLYLVKVGGKAV